MPSGSRAIFACVLTLASIAFAADTLPQAVPNDNRTPAGQLDNGVLTIALEMREARWFPGGSDHPDGVPIYAFAETGKPAQDPGPLIRVQEGTEIHASVRNSLSVAVTVHGLHPHPGKIDDAFHLAPGESRQVRFAAGAPGTYYYWATDGRAAPFRISAETELTGAFIVDPPGSHPDDRIFVVNVWFTNFLQPDFTEAVGFNGRTWPDTERLTVAAGEPVHWRIINPTVADHAMHLHGFFYSVTGVGDGERFQQYTAAEQRRVVTEYVLPGHTFDLQWMPERPGNWIFHCHMTAHMGGTNVALRGAQFAADQPAAAHPAGDEHTVDGGGGMHGIVLGITVLPGKVQNPKLVAASAIVPHRLHLFAAERPYERYGAAGASFYLEGGKPASIGPPIVLTRGEPAEITVTNHLPQPTAVHWHGIELESYYDGVPGWGGSSPQVTPPIAPGASFVARMTPPRAGTYIYHTHWHDTAQLTAGMYGPLIVLEPGEKFDPATDKVFVFGRGGVNEWTCPLLINGSVQPPAVMLKAGTKYRFRFINITPNEADLAITLQHNGKTVQWRAIGKDGAALPESQATMQDAAQQLTVGETRDFEYTPPEFGVYELKATSGFAAPVAVVQPMAAFPPFPVK